MLGSIFTLPKSVYASSVCADRALRRIVHVELDRMRRVLEADDFAHLQVDVGIDQIVVEHADAARLHDRVRLAAFGEDGALDRKSVV